MLEMFLVENGDDFVTYDYYYDGEINDNNKGRVSYSKKEKRNIIDFLAENDSSNKNAGVALAKIRDLVSKNNFPKKEVVAWY